MRVRRKKARQSSRAVTLVESAPRKKRSPMMQLIESVFRKTKDPIQRKKKINAILDLNGKGSTNNEELVESEGETMTKKTKKNLVEAKLLRQVKEMKHESRVRDLCEDIGLRPTRVQLKALTKLTTKKEVKELAESMRGRGDARKGAKSREGGEGKLKKVTTKQLLEDLSGFELEEDDQEDE